MNQASRSVTVDEQGAKVVGKSQSEPALASTLCPVASVLDELAIERIYPEEAKKLGYGVDARTPFARDHARILHSAALRKLADKTQVVSPGESNSPRNRLTHSLEVAQIGKAIALGIGCNSDLVELAGLAHDIGHPPFGHNGEKALAEYMHDAGGFEANAQNIRVLTSLEPKILTPEGISVGLNLTRASLRACIKYPWSYSEKKQSKYGVYDCDVPIMEWIRWGEDSANVSIEAQVMDFADDVAYSVHDIEDGIISGRVSLRALCSKESVKTLANWPDGIVKKEDEEQFWLAAHRLTQLPVVQKLMDFQGTYADIVALKAFTSEMVGRFITAAISASYTEEKNGLRYIAFTVPDSILTEVKVLKNLALDYIKTNTHHFYKQEIERHVLVELAHKVEADPIFYMPPPYNTSIHHAGNEAERKRVIADFLSSLTEREVYFLSQARNMKN